MKVLKRQGIILASACWGIVPYLIGFVRELGEDGTIPMFEWLQSILGIAIVLLHWAYFLPAFAVTFVLRIPLYAPMNVLHPTNPANPATWILPVVGASGFPGGFCLARAHGLRGRRVVDSRAKGAFKGPWARLSATRLLRACRVVLPLCWACCAGMLMT